MKRTLAMVAGFLILAGCGGPSQTVAVDQYTQTWTTAYGSTTCADWSGKMDDHQRFVAAGDMLDAVRKDVWHVQPVPSDSLIVLLQQNITSDCVNPMSVISDVASVAMNAGDNRTAYDK